LPIPGYFGEIGRAVTVKVKAKDRHGKLFRLKAEGSLAQAVEHEVEHLDGILHIDHLESREKLFDVIQEERNKQALLSIDCLAPDQSNRAIPHAKRGG
jgi:peptide deformylase